MSVRFVDVTGDGELDQLGFAADGSVTVAVHGPNRTFVQLAQELPRIHPTQVVVADFNGDLRPDVLLVSAAECTFLAGDGTGYFVDATRAMGLAHLSAIRSCEVVDADSDGTSDLLFHGLDADHLYWGQAGGPFLEQVPPAVSQGQAAVGGRAQAVPIGVPPQAPELVTAGLTQEQKRILGHMSMEELDDGAGNQRPTIRVSGVTLQLVNGLGATNGFTPDPFSIEPLNTITNGVGNLIVGYNESQPYNGPRMGSHNLVIGQQQSFVSYGGCLAGQENTSSGPFACVTGGSNNIASAYASSISGGTAGIASGIHSSISGGLKNITSGQGSAILGGDTNSATGLLSCVAAGFLNTAAERYASVTGGQLNQALAQGSSVTGGVENTASGGASCIAGGLQNKTSGSCTAVAGGYLNEANGERSVACGGDNNKAEGSYSLVAGGSANVAAGGATAAFGGSNNLAEGTRGVTVGGVLNRASAFEYGVVIGGRENQALNNYSLVTGGRWNKASGEHSVLSGGANRTAPGLDDWVAGSLFENN